MKRIIIYLLAVLPLAGFYSCENDLKPYHETQDRLNFTLDDPRVDKWIMPIRYTFIYDITEEMTQDIIWVEIETMGYVTDTDRTIKLIQLDTTDMAVAGVHYVGFDDPQYSEYYKIKAGQNKATIPVIVKRDASLKTQIKNLLISFGHNDNFDAGYPDRSKKLIQIADMPIKPDSWNRYIGYYFAGYYGQVKHQFMIDMLRPLGATADYDFFYNILPDPNYPDMALTDYWYAFFNDALAAENAARAEAGLDPLKEKDGTVVVFNNKAQLPEWED